MEVIVGPAGRNRIFRICKLSYHLPQHSVQFNTCQLHTERTLCQCNACRFQYLWHIHHTLITAHCTHKEQAITQPLLLYVHDYISPEENCADTWWPTEWSLPSTVIWWKHDLTWPSCLILFFVKGDPRQRPKMATVLWQKPDWTWPTSLILFCVKGDTRWRLR